MPEPNLLNGKEMAEEVSQALRDVIATLAVTPTLAIIQVGGRQDSSTYIRLKEKFAAAVGVKTLHVTLPNTATEAEVTSAVERLNADESVHGIIVQLPLDSVQPIDSATVINCIAPAKDVDGLTYFNSGQLTQGKALVNKVHLPPTPLGCLELIRKTGVSIAGSRAVVIGRSAIVGAPVAQLLLWNDATVTVCHSKTTESALADICRRADILVVAAGQAKLVKKSWVKEGAVVIDVGINELEDSSRKSGYRLVGDVDFEEVKDVAGWITPVPGGVGPMTVAMLISNTVNAAKVQSQSVKAD